MLSPSARQSGNDYLFGDSGSNLVFGGGGNTIYGGKGGAGYDFFDRGWLSPTLIRKRTLLALTVKFFYRGTLASIVDKIIYSLR